MITVELEKEDLMRLFHNRMIAVNTVELVEDLLQKGLVWRELTDKPFPYQYDYYWDSTKLVKLTEEELWELYKLLK